MAITYIAGGTQANSTNNGGNVTLTLPTLLQGDVVVVFGGHEPRAGVAAIPSGYTSIYDSGNGAATPHFAVSYKVMGSTPDTTVSCPGSGNSADATAYACYCMRGVDTGTPVDQTATNAGPTTSTAPNSPSITTVTNAAEVLALFLAMSNDAAVTGPGGSYTNNSRAANSNDTNAATVGGFTANKATAGAEDPPAYSNLASGAWRAVTAAMRPASLVAKTGSDSLTPKIDEAKTLLSSSTRTDSLLPKIDESKSLLVIPTTRTDTLAPLVTDTITSLAEGWDFQVRGVNAEGDGNWSNTATVWLPLAAFVVIEPPVLSIVSDPADPPEYVIGNVEEGDEIDIYIYSDEDLTTLEDTGAGTVVAGDVTMSDAPGALSAGEYWHVATITRGASTSGFSNVCYMEVEDTAPAEEAETTAWVNAVVTAGGTVSSTQRGRVDALILALKTNSWFGTNVRRLWIPAGESVSQQGEIDLIELSPLTTGGSLTYSAGGVTGDGSTGYAETDMIMNDEFPNPGTPDAGGLIVAIQNNRTAGAFYACCGVLSSANDSFRHFPNFNGSVAISQIVDGSQIFPAATTAKGVTLIYRYDSSDIKTYLNGAWVQTDTSASNGYPLYNMRLYAEWQEGGVGLANFSADTISVIGFVTKFADDTESAAFSDVINDYLTAWGIGLY